MTSAAPRHPRKVTVLASSSGVSRLAISGASLLAASGNASLFKKDAVTRLFGKLEKRGKAALARSWKDWEKHVRNDRPRLLVLLPHHDKDEHGLEFLQTRLSLPERTQADMREAWLLNDFPLVSKVLGEHLCLGQ